MNQLCSILAKKIMKPNQYKLLVGF